MGQGIDLANATDPAFAKALDNMKDQLILVLVNRLGGAVDVPVAEIDSTGSAVLMMEVDQAGQSFRFEVRRKQ